MPCCAVYLCQVTLLSSCWEAKGVALYRQESTFSYCPCQFAAGQRGIKKSFIHHALLHSCLTVKVPSTFTLLSRVSLMSLWEPYPPGGPIGGGCMGWPLFPDLGMLELVLGGRPEGSTRFRSSLKGSSFFGGFPWKDTTQNTSVNLTIINNYFYIFSFHFTFVLMCFSHFY